MKITKAIIPVAGIGSRFLPASKSIPKVLFPIIDKPVLHYIVEDAIKSGIKEIIFVTSKNNQAAIKNYFSPNKELDKILQKKGRSHYLKEINEIIKKVKFSYVNQPTPRGDGDAVLYGAKKLRQNESAVVMWGDDVIIGREPTVGQLIKVYQKYKGPVCLVEKIQGKDIEKYGVIKGKKVSSRIFEVSQVIEKPKLKDAPSKFGVVGNYVITSEVVEALKNQKLTPRGEIGLAEALDEVTRQASVYAYQLRGRRFDCGSKEGWLMANTYLGARYYK